MFSILNPMELSDLQFNIFLSLFGGIFFLLPAVFTLYLLHLTCKIESTRKEISEP
jgi:hypothetical protein